jgi:hypothetical protein
MTKVPSLTSLNDLVVLIHMHSLLQSWQVRKPLKTATGPPRCSSFSMLPVGGKEGLSCWLTGWGGTQETGVGLAGVGKVS